MVARLVGSYLVSERRGRRVLRLARATYRYKSCLYPRTELRMRIREIAQARVLYGHLTIRVLLNCKAWMRVDLVTRMFVLSAQWHRDLHCKDF
jgi:putative transposase